MTSQINHVSVNARDLDESVEFYVELLDAEPIPTPNFGVPVRWLALGATQLHLFERDVEPRSYHHLGITVDDLERAYRVADRRGAFDRETFGNHLVELPGDVVQLYVRDPAGNLVELDQPGVERLPDDVRRQVKPLWELHPQSEEQMRGRLFVGAETSGMSVEEARLEDVGSGLAPVSPGWFVANVGEAAWLRHDAFGGRCVFESSRRVLAERPDLEPQSFAHTGFTLAVLAPGKPTGMYHAESSQEDFLVLAGTCLLIVEEEERPLRAWDFVHCTPGTRHTFVGTGDEPCVIFMTGARREGDTIVYPRSETARARSAGVDTETNSPAEAYAPFGHWRLGRPDAWAELPWA